MAKWSRTYTFTDGTTAYGSQVESEIAIIKTTWDAHDDGTSTWSNVKVSSSGTNPADVTGSGATTDLSINNTATDGDPRLVLKLSGTAAGMFYVDDSDSDKPKISDGTNDLCTFTPTTGELTPTGPVIPPSVSGTPSQHGLYRENVVKAWACLNGTGAIALRDSFNVSGVTDNGTGDYTFTWDRDFANANYSVVGSSDAPEVYESTGSRVVGAARFLNANSSGVAGDVGYLCVIACGDQ